MYRIYNYQKYNYQKGKISTGFYIRISEESVSHIDVALCMRKKDPLMNIRSHVANDIVLQRYSHSGELSYKIERKDHEHVDVLLCGDIDIDREFTIDDVNIIINCLNEENADELINNYPGSYVIAIVKDKGIWLYNSTTSIYDVFWKTCGNSIIISTHHIDFLENYTDYIDDKKLFLYSYSLNVFPFNGINICRPGHALVKNQSKVNIYPISPINEQEEQRTYNSINDYSEELYEKFLQSVKRKLGPYNKVGLLLSGGIDSAMVARALYDLNIDTICYTWASPTMLEFDEGKFATQMCNLFGFPLRLIAVDGKASEALCQLCLILRFHIITC